MSRLINQGEYRDEFGITYELLINDETGARYHAYAVEALEERRSHLEGLAVSGQQPGYPLLEEQTDREVAAAR